MRLRKAEILAIGLTLLFLCSSSQASEDYADLNLCKPTSPEYYKDRERGWFYNEYCQKKKQEKKEKTDQSVPAKRPPIDWAKVQDPDYLDELDAKEFKELLDQVRSEAVYKPDNEKIHVYVKMQDYMKNKSLKFAYVWRDVLLQHPELDPTVKTPPSNYGAQALDKILVKENQSVMAEIKEEVGLFFFVSDTCPYCHEQAKIMARFRREYDITVKTISKDNCSPLFQDCSLQPNMFESFNVQTTPTLIAVFRGEDGAPVFQPVANGIVTGDDIVNRLVYYYKFQRDKKYPES